MQISTMHSETVGQSCEADLDIQNTCFWRKVKPLSNCEHHDESYWVKTNLGLTGSIKEGKANPAVPSTRAGFVLRGDIEGGNACVAPSLSQVFQTSPSWLHFCYTKSIFLLLAGFSLQFFSMEASSSLSRGWVILNNKEDDFSVILFLITLSNHVSVGRSVGPGEQCWHLTFGEVEFASLDSYKKVAEINLRSTIRMTNSFLPSFPELKVHGGQCGKMWKELLQYSKEM